VTEGPPGRGGEPDRFSPPRVGLLLTLLARRSCSLLPLPPLAITFRFCDAASSVLAENRLHHACCLLKYWSRSFVADLSAEGSDGLHWQRSWASGCEYEKFVKYSAIPCYYGSVTAG
jgi:hypothetical protein